MKWRAIYTTRPAAARAWSTDSTFTNVGSLPGAWTSRTGFAGHAPAQWPIAALGTLEEMSSNGSSPNANVASASDSTTHALPLGRARGNATTSQTRPIAAAHAARTPTRGASG